MESELRLTVSLLGPFQVSIGGQPLDTFRTSKVQALLVYLLVERLDHPAVGIARERAVTWLWPEMPQKSGRDNLRQTLYLLRQAIPEVTGEDGEPVPFVLGDNQRIWVNPAATYDLDVATFRSLLQDGGRAQLERAVELYRGDFLADFYLPDRNAFEEWAGQKRAALRRRALRALERLAASYLEEGQPDRALEYARRQLEIDDLRESASRQLMEALSRSGRRNEALVHYERWRERLWEELGVAPTAETQALASVLRSEKRLETGRERAWEDQLPGGPVTFLFTDIEGSSRLWERDAQAMQHALLKHDRLLQAEIKEQGGEVIKSTGDGFYAVFRDPRQGVQAAVAAQQALARERWDPSVGPLTVRMGLLTGPAEPREGDYFGKSVNRAARLCDAAHGGQILVSAVAQALVQDDLSGDLSLLDLGIHHLRGMSRPEHIYQVCAPELRTEFPPLRTPSGRRHTLPEPPAPLLGREKELADVEELLANGNRLVTIVGPGGIGKTRLALEVARNAAESFADGAAFISLAPLSDAEAVVPAVAQALRFGFQSGDRREPKMQLLDYLRRKDLLLVLDNFEHLLKATPLLTDMVRAAPDLRLLTTSRERLKLQAEQVFPLQGLALSQWKSLVEAQDDPAAQLFQHHAQQVRPSFTLRVKHLKPLQEILRLVGGMPLAIILAARWVEVLSPAEIAAEISRSLDVLEAMERDVPDRHRSMRAIFDMTWGRLSARDQAHFAALSLFRGGFTMVAAREVAGASPRDLMRLVDRSLLSRGEDDRFEVHELLRQFAAEQLSRTPEQGEAVREKHSRYFCEFLQKCEEDMKGSRSLEVEAEIAADFENVRTAWNWAVDNAEDLVYQAQAALLLFCTRVGRIKEGETAFGQAMAGLEKRDQVDARRMANLLAWGSYFIGHRSLEEAEGLLRQATGFLIDAAEQGKDVRAEEAFILLMRGSLRRTASESLVLLKESLSLYQELGKHFMMAWVQQLIGSSYRRQAKYRKAFEHSRRAMQLMEMVGDRKMALWPKMSMAKNLASMGRLAEAEEGVRDAFTFAETTGDERTRAVASLSLAEILILSGYFEEALPILDESRAHFANLGNDNSVRWCFIEQCITTLHLGRYDEVRDAVEDILDSDQEFREDEVFLQAEASFLQGQAALALDRLHEARTHLKESLKTCRSLNLPSAVASSQALMAYVEVHAGDQVTVRYHLTEALAPGLFMPSLEALPAAALLLAELSKKERAVESYALARTYEFVGNSRWFEDVAGRHINAVAETMPPDVVAAARARGQARDLWETVEELLQELEDMEL